MNLRSPTLVQRNDGDLRECSSHEDAIIRLTISVTLQYGWQPLDEGAIAQLTISVLLFRAEFYSKNMLNNLLHKNNGRML